MSASTPLPAMPPRLLFAGTAGILSAQALQAVLASELPVVGVLVPGSPGGPPVVRHAPPVRRLLPLAGEAGAPNVLDLAWQHAVPVLAVGKLGHTETLAALTALAPDLICVACFPHRLPEAMLARAPLGGINLHPSRLPAGRGPAPAFWAFRHGLAETGVTVHQMTQALDAGPILAQVSLTLPDGMFGTEFDRQAGHLGGRLLVEAARALAAGTVVAREQDPALATYDPWPAADDYLVTPDHPARWAFNFICGVVGNGGPLAVLVGDRRLPVAAALAFDEDGVLGQPWRSAGDWLWLQCSPGVLQVQLAE